MKVKILSLIAAVAVLTGCAGLRKTDCDAQGRKVGSFASSESIAQAKKDGRLPGDFTDAIRDRVFFAFDRSDLDAEAIQTLKEQAAWLNAYKDAKVVIEGHCDERGTREYNLALGARRANSVKRFLISQGVSAANIKTISYGKERPAVEGSNETAWAQNRRAVSITVE
jgi:peptidoglycan-associated lipoprotein